MQETEEIYTASAGAFSFSIIEKKGGGMSCFINSFH
jgi:hypothetical protein